VANAAAKFAVVSLYADDQRALIAASLANKQAYCRRHGCALYVPGSLAASPRAREYATAHYTKILAVEYALRHEALQHEWVVWTDADAIFFNMSISPAEALTWALGNAIPGSATHAGPIPGVPFPASKPLSPDAAASVDLILTWPLNTGCFFVRNSPAALALLERWFAHDLPGKDVSRSIERRWNDQGALIDILAAFPDARQRVAYVNYETHPLAAEWPWYGTHSWQVHMPGRPLMQKVRLLQRLDDERRDIQAFFQ
jgi:galactosyl transferase GMA12/MNN10 family